MGVTGVEPVTDHLQVILEHMVTDGHGGSGTKGGTKICGELSPGLAQVASEIRAAVGAIDPEDRPRQLRFLLRLILRSTRRRSGPAR